MAMILPLALHFAFFSEPEHRRRSGSAWPDRAGDPMSLSPSAVLGTTAALVILLVSWTPEQRKRVLTALPFFAVGVRVAIPGLLGTIVSAFQHIGGDPASRAATSGGRWSDSSSPGTPTSAGGSAPSTP